MKILAMSDIHNEFDRFDPASLPDADLCIVAGDITNFGIEEAPEFQQSQEWMREIAQGYPMTYWIPGNHDLGVPDWSGYPTLPLRPMPTDIYTRPRCISLLERRDVFLYHHEQYVLYGVSLSPAYAMPRLVNEWCLMTADADEERAAYDLPRADILVSHSPPYGILDETDGLHIGSEALVDYIDRHHPKLVICGHVHNGGGVERRGETEIHNVACQWRLIEINQ